MRCVLISANCFQIFEMTSKDKGLKNKTNSQRKGVQKRNGKSVDAGMPRIQVISFIVGIVLLFFALFMLLAFTSYIYSGADDYSILDSLDGNPLPDPVPLFKNSCGLWGAQSAFFYINKCFGLAAYFIPVYLILLGLKLVGSFRLKATRLFIILGICMIWTSMLFSTPLVRTSPLFEHSHVNPGGQNGSDIATWLMSFLGEPGLYGILVLVAIFILLYFSYRTIEIIRSLLRLNGIRKFVRSHKSDDENVINADEEDNAEEPSEVVDDEAEPVDNGVVDVNTGEIFQPETPEKEAFKSQNLFETLQNGGSVDEPETHVAEEPENGVMTVEFKPTEPETKPAENPDEVSFTFDEIVKNAGSDIKKPGDNAVEFTISDEPKEEEFPEEKEPEPVHYDMSKPYDPHKDLEFYETPPFSLLEHPDIDAPQIDMEEQTANKEQIIKVLHSFGVEISSIKATIGPTITLYEITPAEGMRISKIRNLEDDIALSLAAEGIRIIAPIPGKGTIGIEVPNKTKAIVSMDSVLESKKFQETKMELPCALGKTITNEVFMIDLTKAPHLLVAGATGMGKSVGLNAIITSLLYKKHPSELKIVMVDPKKVEFSIYSPIENHFLAKLEDEDEPIITDVQHVVKTLNSLCQLMDHRYDLLKRAQVRTIKEYNEKFKARQLDPRVGHEYMPYYVVIIDEFGDLIMTAGKEIELPICRIAQLARAVGIHMIIATQRPSVQIITGAIKANFPARIAFRVAAMQDSRTIIDRPGANQLIGRGDMLYLQGGDPVRVQCAFVDTPEVSRICKYISTQQGYPHAAYLPEVVAEGEEGVDKGDDLGHLDPMFAECARLIVSKQQGSTSLLQRQFSIGYNRAGRLMDQMEKAGVVGPQVGSKPRDVLIQDFNTLDRLISSLM